MKYQHLRSAYQIGSMIIKNRLIMTAAGCELTDSGGTVTEEYLAYYEARAKGGVGAVITELMRVDPVTGVMNPGQVRLWPDGSIRELSKLVSGSTSTTAM